MIIRESKWRKRKLQQVARYTELRQQISKIIHPSGNINMWFKIFHVYVKVSYVVCGLGSSVGIVTDYGLDGQRSNPGKDEIFCLSGPALGFTQPPVKWVRGLSWGWSAAGACCWPLTPL